MENRVLVYCYHDNLALTATMCQSTFYNRKHLEDFFSPTIIEYCAKSSTRVVYSLIFDDI